MGWSRRLCAPVYVRGSTDLMNVRLREAFNDSFSSRVLCGTTRVCRKPTRSRLMLPGRGVTLVVGPSSVCRQSATCCWTRPAVVRHISASVGARWGSDVQHAPPAKSHVCPLSLATAGSRALRQDFTTTTECLSLLPAFRSPVIALTFFRSL